MSLDKQETETRELAAARWIFERLQQDRASWRGKPAWSWDDATDDVRSGWLREARDLLAAVSLPTGGGGAEGELPPDAMTQLAYGRVLDELARSGGERDDVDTAHLAERLVGVAHSVFPIPDGERQRALAQALVNIDSELDCVDDEIDPDPSDLSDAIGAARQIIRGALPPGTLEGWAEEANDG